jgi:hypothetical protein
MNKNTTLTLVAALALTPIQIHADDPPQDPKFTALELCLATAIIGTGIALVIYYKCKGRDDGWMTNTYPPAPEPEPPDDPPPTNTNSTNSTNMTVLKLFAGPSTYHPGQDGSIAFVTRLDSGNSFTNLVPLYWLTNWIKDGRKIIVLSDTNGTPLLTNWSRTMTNSFKSWTANANEPERVFRLLSQ